MKKYLMTGMAAIVFCGAFTSCSHDLDNGGDSTKTTVEETYEKAFITHFGQPAETQTWGFGSSDKSTTRSITTPAVATLPAPYTEADVTTYLATAKEPNSENINDNYDDSYTSEDEGYWSDPQPESFYFNTSNSLVNTLLYNYEWGDAPQEEKDFWKQWIKPYLDGNYTFYWNSPTQEDAMHVVKLILDDNNRSDWYVYTPAKESEFIVTNPGGYHPDETFVLNFKITQNYTGIIGVAATEGYNKTYNAETNQDEYTTRQDPYYARTIMVKNATWNINDNQRIGSGGIIVVADGGTINIAEGKKLEMVNHARLVVLRGGTVTGQGNVFVTNGNGEGEENYNAGTISVAKFNNNFGKFYNYGKFLVNEYDAGATESNFYNHSLVNIDHTGVTPNARIFNACQFYVQHDARLRNYEGVNGSALIVGGQLMPFGSEDATTVPSYVSLAAGALVKCGSLYNGSNWVGPTEGGYAALEIDDQIDYMTWVQDHPENGGYFANNIYVKCGNWQNDPAGQGYHQDDPTDEYNYMVSRAEYKFWSVAANCTGNGNVTKIIDGDTAILTADEDFELGEKGCTPGFKGDVPPVIPPVDNSDKIVVIAEDLTIDDARPDFDFNDVVFQVNWNKTENTVTVDLLAAGGTLPLYIGGTSGVYTDGKEVHEAFAEVNRSKVITTGTMMNTWAGKHSEYTTPTFEVTNFNHSATTIGEVAASIIVAVKKFGDFIELTAPRGGVPTKIAVKTDFLDYGWCDERQDIDDRFNKDGKPLFKSYVKGELDDNWYQELHTSHKQ